jgi:hypothetical protein
VGERRTGFRRSFFFVAANPKNDRGSAFRAENKDVVTELGREKMNIAEANPLEQQRAEAHFT